MFYFSTSNLFNVHYLTLRLTFQRQDCRCPNFFRNKDSSEFAQIFLSELLFMKSGMKELQQEIREYFLKQVEHCLEINEIEGNSMNSDSKCSIKPRGDRHLLNYPGPFILTALSGKTSNLDMQANESTIIKKLS